MIQLAVETEKIKKEVFDEMNAANALIYSIITFVVLTTIAMLCYPGGNFFDHSSIGYSFWENFYSDLGRYKTFSGGNKNISTFFFVIAVFQMSWFIAYFFKEFIFKVSQIDNHYSIQKLVRTSAFAYGILLASTAITPYDRLLLVHALVANFSFVAMTFVAFGTAFLTYKINFPKSYTFVFVLLGMLLVVYIILLFTVRSLVQGANPYFHPTAQKIMVVCIISALVYLASGYKKFVDKY